MGSRQKLSDLQMIKWLLSHLSPYKSFSWIPIVFLITASIAEPALAMLLAPFMDGAFSDKNYESIKWMPIWFVGLFALRGFANYFSNISLTWIMENVLHTLRLKLFQHMMLLPCAFLDRATSGAMISKFTYELTQIRDTAIRVIIAVVRDVLMIVVLLLWMLYLDWKLFTAIAIAAPVVVLIINVVRLKLRSVSQKLIVSMSDIVQVVNELVANYRVIKSYRAEKQQYERFKNISHTNFLQHFRYAYTSLLASPLIEVIASLLLGFVIYFASQNASQETLSVGGFTSFFAAFMMLMAPLKRVIAIQEALQKALTASRSLVLFLEEGIEDVVIDNAIEEVSENHKRFSGQIRFENIDFCYPDITDLVLQNFSLNIASKEMVAIVGGSGSGKSTLTALLLGFYCPTAGNIYLDDENINDMPLSTLRTNIGLASQDILLFNDTVRNNIAFGAQKNAAWKDIKEAAKEAEALSFIEELPQQFDTIIGERGIALSGGQRQRLSIARALLKKPPVLIFDEATSALDYETEAKVQHIFEKMRGETTCIVIAHRLSTIRNADRILVLDKGAIVEMGTHLELLEKRGPYQALYQKSLEPSLEKKTD